jgi:hypothetical protein
MRRLEAIRLAASVEMGVTPDMAAAAQLGTIPKIGIVSAPADYATLAGRQLKEGEIDLAVRMISMGQPHRATPITGALCLRRHYSEPSSGDGGGAGGTQDRTPIRRGASWRGGRVSRWRAPRAVRDGLPNGAASVRRFRAVPVWPTMTGGARVRDKGGYRCLLGYA